MVRTRPAYKTVYGERKELEHERIARTVLGKDLPIGAQVHHVDGNGLNNAHENLVICPSQEYHFLLHRRQIALDSCGNANWQKCTQCQQWDAPKNLRIYEYREPKRTRRVVHHIECWQEMRKKKYAAKNKNIR